MREPPAPLMRARPVPWPRHVGACLLVLATVGCHDLPTEAMGITGDASTTTDDTGSGETTVVATGSTSQGDATGSTSSGLGTTEESGSGSSEDTGEPLPSCGDGLVAAGELCHELGPPIAVAPAPMRIATGDLDLDGATDLVLANPNAPELQVLYGVGDGDFVAPQLLLTAGTAVDDLALGDVTGDGSVDLVLTDDTGARVVSYANDGGGGLFFAGLYPAPLAPLRITLGDVDGDGTPDLVAAGSGTASLMLGNGLAGFLPVQDLALPAGPHRLGLFELDGDGVLDLLTVNGGGGNTTCFLGDGVGLGEGVDHDTAATPEGLAVGDIDEDGFADLVVAHAAGDDVGVLLGDGSGALGAADLRMVGDDPRAMVLADLDHDGHLDLAIAHTVPGQVALHLGVGDGTFVPGPVHVVEGAAELALAEINGDGVPDLVILRPQSSAVQVLRSAP